MQSPSNLCDGISDCADGSDESKKICNPTFNCTNNMAVGPSRLQTLVLSRPQNTVTVVMVVSYWCQHGKACLGRI